MCSGNCDKAEGSRLLQFQELRGKVTFLNMSQSCVTNAAMAITLSTEKSLIQKLSIEKMQILNLRGYVNLAKNWGKEQRRYSERCSR